MNLTAEQITAINETVEKELAIQNLLLQARELAANRIVNYFKNPAASETNAPPVIRLAIQFTARAFAPFQAVLRAHTTPQPQRTKRPKQQPTNTPKNARTPHTDAPDAATAAFLAQEPRPPRRRRS